MKGESESPGVPSAAPAGPPGPPGPSFYVLFAILAALTAWPVLKWEFVTAVDYPAHISIVRVLRLAFEDPSLFRDTFGTRLLQPYWGFYLPVLALSALVPLDLAGKLAAAGIILMIPVALLVLARAEGVDPRVSLAGFPLAHSFSAFFGFHSFLAGTGIALLGLVPALSFVRTRSARSLAALHAASLLVFLAHATAWGFFLGWTGWILLAARPRLRAGALLRAGSAFVLPAVLMLLWNGSVESSGTLKWMREHPVDTPLPDRLADLAHIAFPAFAPGAEAALLAFFLVLLGLLALSGRGPDGGVRTARWLGMAGWMAAAYFVVPHQFLGLNFAYERTLLFALLFPLLAAAPRLKFPKVFAVSAAVLAAGSALSADEMARAFNA